MVQVVNKLKGKFVMKPHKFFNRFPALKFKYLSKAVIPAYSQLIYFLERTSIAPRQQVSSGKQYDLTICNLTNSLLLCLQ